MKEEMLNALALDHTLLFTHRWTFYVYIISHVHKVVLSASLLHETIAIPYDRDP